MEQEQKLISLFQSLNDDGKELLFDYAKMLSEWPKYSNGAIPFSRILEDRRRGKCSKPY